MIENGRIAFALGTICTLFVHGEADRAMKRKTQPSELGKLSCETRCLSVDITEWE